jgi:amino acid transporter
MIFWVLGFFTSLSSLAVYLEFASYFPNRSGSEVVYLEQAYPRPRWFFPTAFAFQSVALSFSSANAIGEYCILKFRFMIGHGTDKRGKVLAQYLFRINGATPTQWQSKGVAIAGYTVAFIC